MTATLSTRAIIPHYGDEPVELAVEYTYNTRHRELVVHECIADIAGTETEVWHLLTQTQRWSIEEQCVEDYQDRMMQIAENHSMARYG